MEFNARTQGKKLRNHEDQSPQLSEDHQVQAGQEKGNLHIQRLRHHRSNSKETPPQVSSRTTDPPETI